MEQDEDLIADLNAESKDFRHLTDGGGGGLSRGTEEVDDDDYQFISGTIKSSFRKHLRGSSPLPFKYSPPPRSEAKQVSDLIQRP